MKKCCADKIPKVDLFQYCKTTDYCTEKGNTALLLEPTLPLSKYLHRYAYSWEKEEKKSKKKG